MFRRGPLCLAVVCLLAAASCSRGAALRSDRDRRRLLEAYGCRDRETPFRYVMVTVAEGDATTGASLALEHRGLGSSEVVALRQALEVNKERLLECKLGEWVRLVGRYRTAEVLDVRFMGGPPQVQAGCLVTHLTSALRGLKEPAVVILALGATDRTPEMPGLTKKQISDTIRTHIDEVRQCYEEGLRVWPDVRGKIAVHFIVGPDGRTVVAFPADSTMATCPVERCVANAVGRWRFDRPVGRGVVVVTYPFTLQVH